MGGFLVSEEFKLTMMLSTTTAVVSEVMSNTIESLVKKEIEASVQPLRDQISALKSQVNEAKLHSNDNEQYSRRCNLRIYGIPETDGENCYDLVTTFCKEDLKCDFDKNEIDRTHRVGKVKEGSISPRAIIVKFISYQTKAKVLSNRRNLKGRKFFVNEDLTIFNKIIFDKARRSLDKLPVWTADGKILVRSANAKIVRLRKVEDIENVHVNCYLTFFYPHPTCYTFVLI